MKTRIEKLNKLQMKKGDTVKILTGKDKDKQGRILAVNYQNHKVTVEGINMTKKAIRPTRQNQKGGIIDLALPVHVSNVRLVCPKCNITTHIIRKTINNKRVRVCRNEKCNEIIDKV